MNILEEIKRSYETTYIRVKETPVSRWVPFYLSSLDSDTGRMNGLILRSREAIWEPHEISYKESLVNLELPNLGYINIDSPAGTIAYFISLIPERQWKKGLQPRTLHINVFGSSYKVDFHTPTLVWNIFNAEYYPSRISIEKKAGTSVALTPKVAIGYSASDRETTDLMYCGTQVGFVDSNGVFVLFKVYSHLQAYISKLAICEVE